ncbi:MAG: VWA domain-containing protein [Anaerorhabdus sp.]|uniref:VWA domain-containing protein n=1 Tax=Anaerorhabdus sp. TaxID=1872524 RepID=UPI002FC99547
MMKKLVKLFITLTLIFAIVPTESWNVFATNSSAEPVITQDEQKEVTETQLPEEVVIPSATPEVEATPEATPIIPEVEKTEEVKEVSTTLSTIHTYMENDNLVNKEVIIEDLVVGQEINARDYSLTMDNYTIASLSAETRVLTETDNVIYYNYDYQANINRPEISITSATMASKARMSSWVNNDQPGAVFVTKEARWVDEENGIAAIDFTVKGNPVITGSDVLLIVDNSQSMVQGIDRWTPLKDAVQAFVSQLYADVDGKPSTNKIGMISFSDNGYQESGGKFLGVTDLINVGTQGKFTATQFYQQKVWEFLNPNGNATNYEDAFRYATSMFNGIDKSRPRFIIFLSDGVPNRGNYDTAKSYADTLKADGVKIYSLGLQLDASQTEGSTTFVPFEKYIQPLASEPVSQYAKDIKDLTQLEPIYQELAGEMKIAGTQAVITDVINDDVFEVTNKPGTSTSVEMTHGTASVVGNQVTWTLGDITETEKKLTIYVKVNNPDAVGIVETNKNADIDYVDYAGASKNKDIPNAVLTIGDKGSIKMNYYLVDDSGNLISQSGNSITDFSKRVVLKTEMYEKNGDSVLSFGTYRITPPASFELDGKKYILVNDAMFSTTVNDITVNALKKDHNVYYGYKEYTITYYDFTVEHYLEDENGNYIKQTPIQSEQVEYALNKTIYSSDYINDTYTTNYSYDETNKDAITSINTDGTGNVLKLYYNRVMTDVTYKVIHQLPNGNIEETVTKKVWVNDAKELEVTAESLISKAPVGYKVDSIKDQNDNIVTAGNIVADGTVIEISYVKDDTQTKDIKYTVEHWQEGNSAASITTKYQETVWINALDELAVTAESIKPQTFSGFSYSGITPAVKANDLVKDNTVIKIYYSKNSTPVNPPSTPIPTPEPTVEPTPEVFIPIVPNPNPVNPQPEVVPDDNTPEVVPTAKPTTTPETITDESTPEVVGRSWALINLIASLIGVLLTIVLLFAKHEKEEENEENQEVKDEFERKRIYKVIGVIVAVVSIIVFLLTENITLPMKLVDKYTLLMIAFALGNIVCFYFGRKWHEVEDEEVEEQN